MVLALVWDCVNLMSVRWVRWSGGEQTGDVTWHCWRLGGCPVL